MPIKPNKLPGLKHIKVRPHHHAHNNKNNLKHNSQQTRNIGSFQKVAHLLTNPALQHIKDQIQVNSEGVNIRIGGIGEEQGTAIWGRLWELEHGAGCYALDVDDGGEDAVGGERALGGPAGGGLRGGDVGGG